MKKLELSLSAKGRFLVSCEDANGNHKWGVSSHNLVVDVGLERMNDIFFTGESYTANWYVGIYGPQSENKPNPRDTARVHPGWTEITDYLSSVRPAVEFGKASNASPSVITNDAKPARFTVTKEQKIGGAFLIDNDIKGGMNGNLFCVTDFPSPGDRLLEEGDVLNISYEFYLGAG